MWLILGYCLFVVMLLAVTSKLVDAWLAKGERQQRQAAEQVLAAHGMTAHLYLPGVGIKDRDLHAAVSRVAAGGYIITRQDGQIVGALATPSDPGQPRPHLRLVVSND